MRRRLLASSSLPEWDGADWSGRSLPVQLASLFAMAQGHRLSPQRVAAEVEAIRRKALSEGLILCWRPGEANDVWTFERPWVGTFGDLIDSETGEVVARAVVRQDGDGYRAECCDTGREFVPSWHEEITYREAEVPPLFDDE